MLPSPPQLESSSTSVEVASAKKSVFAVFTLGNERVETI